MEKFMLIVRADLAKLKTLAEENRFADWPDMVGWVKAITDSGNYIGGSPLALAGRYVSQREVLSDGPFIESKEGVLGYDIILARNIDEAVVVAQACPMVKAGLAIREVRPLLAPAVPAP